MCATSDVTQPGSQQSPSALSPSQRLGKARVLCSPGALWGWHSMAQPRPASLAQVSRPGEEPGMGQEGQEPATGVPTQGPQPARWACVDTA